MAMHICKSYKLPRLKLKPTFNGLKVNIGLFAFTIMMRPSKQGILNHVIACMISSLVVRKSFLVGIGADIELF